MSFEICQVQVQLGTFETSSFKFLYTSGLFSFQRFVVVTELRAIPNNPRNLQQLG